MASKQEQEEKKRLLIELEALATKLNFPADKRTDYRWLSHRAMIAGVQHLDFQRIVQIARKLAIMNHDCFVGFPLIGV